MFGIGGSGMFSMVAEVGLSAATGGTSMAIEAAAQQVMKSVLSDVLQEVGTQLGLPQSFISAAQTTAGAMEGGASSDEAASSASAQFGASATEQGQFASAIDTFKNNLVQSALDMIRQSGEGDGKPSGATASGGGKSVLLAIAEAMGKVMDDKMNQMAADAQKLGTMDTQSSQYGSTTAEIQALGQELSMISNAVNSAIKSVGEAGSTLAKKD